MHGLRVFYLIAFICCCNGSSAQADSIGLFDYHCDIGHPKNAGSAQYDKVTHTYTLKGSGYNIWFDRD